MKIKKYSLMALCVFCSLSTFSQSMGDLWISGSAVPGGTQKLICVDGNLYQAVGALKAGEVKIQTTEKVNSHTRFLVPNEVDASLVNEVIAWREETNPEAAGWQVLFAEEHYRITVNPANKTMQGELVKPWHELFVGGGSTKNAWNPLHMQAFTQDSKNPYVWTWTGELRKHPNSEEPLSFKLEGQLAWGPKQLHPLTDGEDVLQSRRFRKGGADTKWKLSKEGRYRIKVDILHETIEAKFLGK